MLLPKRSRYHQSDWLARCGQFLDDKTIGWLLVSCVEYCTKKRTKNKPRIFICQMDVENKMII